MCLGGGLFFVILLGACSASRNRNLIVVNLGVQRTQAYTEHFGCVLLAEVTIFQHALDVNSLDITQRHFGELAAAHAFNLGG